jgi:hypothetical protein
VHAEQVIDTGGGNCQRRGGGAKSGAGPRGPMRGRTKEAGIAPGLDHLGDLYLR